MVLVAVVELAVVVAAVVDAPQPEMPETVAAAGILWGYLWPYTKIAHAGHVLLSTWASLFHMIMALGTEFSAFSYIPIALFLFLAVWIPCCTSDIVFPLLFAKK